MNAPSATAAAPATDYLAVARLAVNHRPTQDPNLFLGSGRNGKTNATMHVRTVMYFADGIDGQQGEALGYVCRSVSTYKWVAVFNVNGKEKRQSPVDTMDQAIAKFSKLIKNNRASKITKILATA